MELLTKKYDSAKSRYQSIISKSRQEIKELQNALPAVDDELAMLNKDLEAAAISGRSADYAETARKKDFATARKSYLQDRLKSLQSKPTAPAEEIQALVDLLAEEEERLTQKFNKDFLPKFYSLTEEIENYMIAYDFIATGKGSVLRNVGKETTYPTTAAPKLIYAYDAFIKGAVVSGNISAPYTPGERPLTREQVHLLEAEKKEWL